MCEAHKERRVGEHYNAGLRINLLIPPQEIEAIVDFNKLKTPVSTVAKSCIKGYLQNRGMETR